MCDGNCSTCGSQCPMSKLAAKFRKEPEPKAESKDNTTIPTNKEESKMSEQSTLSCHSGPDEKLVSHGERINALSASGRCCIGCLALTAVAVIGGCLYLNGKINDAQIKNAEEITRIKTEYSIRLAAVEKTCEDLKAECEQARRDYTNARQTVSRARRSQ